LAAPPVANPRMPRWPVTNIPFLCALLEGHNPGRLFRHEVVQRFLVRVFDESEADVSGSEANGLSEVSIMKRDWEGWRYIHTGW
jgi:hypothetical protein